MLVSVPIVVILSFIIGFVGASRRCGFWGYFFASLLFTPLIGLILVLVSPNKNVDNNIHLK